MENYLSIGGGVNKQQRSLGCVGASPAGLGRSESEYYSLWRAHTHIEQPVVRRLIPVLVWSRGQSRCQSSASDSRW